MSETEFLYEEVSEEIKGPISAKQFVKCVIHTNKLLKRIPDPSLTTPAAKMPEDKILDLLEASTPQSLKKHTHLQGFRPLKTNQ